MGGDRDVHTGVFLRDPVYDPGGDCDLYRGGYPASKRRREERRAGSGRTEGREQC